jgi:hypothetical protein
MMPSRLTSPRVGRRPTRLCAEAGDRIDCPVSLARAEDRKIRGDRGPGAAARPAGVPRQVVGISCLPAERADRRAATGQLGQVGLGEDQRAGLPQPLDDERVAGR